MPWKDKERANESSRRYKAEHRDEVRERGKEYYSRNRDKILERQKGKREENPEVSRKKGRDNYARNREKILKARSGKSEERKDLEREYGRAYREAHREELAAKAREYYHAHKKERQDADRLRKYGITGDEFDAMINSQGNKCALCMDPFDETKDRQIHVDHCHETGGVRGLLCKDCNTGLGHLKDNPSTLRRAILYLERFSQAMNDNDNHRSSKESAA